MRGGEISRLSAHRGRQRYEDHVRKGGRRVRVLQCADPILARASHSRRHFRQQQRRHDDRVGFFLNAGEERQAVRVAVFVWVERIHEDARINRIPRMTGHPRS